jgi:hypothetical protein
VSAPGHDGAGPRWRHSSRWLVVLLVLSSSSTACTGERPERTDRAADPSYAGEPSPPTDRTATPRPVTAEDLLGAEIPATCEHAPGALVDGRLPGLAATEGYAEIGTGLTGTGTSDGVPPAFTDVTGDGIDDAVAVLGCSAGGVSWPDVVLLYGPGTALLGAIDLYDVTPAEHATIESLTVADVGVRAVWTTYDGCCADPVRWTALLRWDGGALEATGLAPLD